MNDTMILARLRHFLFVLAALLCVGTFVELWSAEHYQEPIQLLPFILAGLGLATILVVLWRPRRVTMRAMQVVMVLNALGSAFGIYEHIENNLGFELEIRPNAAAVDVFIEALHGASPLLAPGILALAACLSLAASYCHPAFTKPGD